MDYPLSFGMDPGAADFGGGDPYGPPDETFLEKVRRVALARARLAQDMPAEPPPREVSIPRVTMNQEPQSFFSQHQGAAKGIDAAAQILATLSNRRTNRYNNRIDPRYQRPITPIDISTFPSITGELEKNRAARMLNDQKVQEQNARIGESEAKINESAMSRWATRRSAEMGQVMPSVARAAFRDPRAAAVPVYQQKLDTFRQYAKEHGLTADEINKGELRIISGSERTPEDETSAYNKAYARMQAGIDARRSRGVATGAKDQGEVDVADMAKFMFDKIHNEFYSPEEAANAALEYGRNKQKLRKATGGAPTMEANLPPPDLGGRPLSPAGADQSVPPPTGMLRAKPAPGLPPDFQSKLQIYAAQINRHPERRAALRADLMRTYGVDPDLYVESGQ